MNMMFYSEIKGAQFALLGRVGNNFYSQQKDWCNVQECRDECLERWCAGFREISEQRRVFTCWNRLTMETGKRSDTEIYVFVRSFSCEG